jgi:hypothetical protein
MKYMLFTYRDPSVQLEPEQRAAVPAAVHERRVVSEASECNRYERLTKRRGGCRSWRWRTTTQC